MTKEEITKAVDNLKKIRKQFNKYEFTHSIDLAIDALYKAASDGELYPCDGLACKKMCAKTMTVSEWEQYECHHTTDQEHAASHFDAAHNIQVAEALGLRKEAESDELEARARWICCPMCDRDTCNRNADDCDAKKWIEKKEAVNGTNT